MAINILKNNYTNGADQDAMSLEIANGDLAALREVSEKYGVRDEGDMIAFAIGVLKEADGRPIAATKEDGRLMKFIPARSITKMSNTKSKASDDEYREAVQPFVDEAMAPHNLAPAIKIAITENKPLNDALQDVMVETVNRNPDMKKALDKAISENKAIKDSHSELRKPAFWLPILITGLLSLMSIIISLIKH